MSDDGARYDNTSVGNGRVGNWMQTYSGRQFWPLDPRPEDICIEDIAHALSNICRYAGHCERFYSVAEHSVLVSLCVDRELALTGLLHDATEAYVSDVIRPIKPHLTNYSSIENSVWVAIAKKFGLPVVLPPEIKKADTGVLLAEAEQNMKTPPADWCVSGEPAEVKLLCLLPAYAKDAFLNRFRHLTA